MNQASYKQMATPSGMENSQTFRQDDGSALDLGAFLNTLWRGKWLIALITSFCIGCGLYYAYSVAVPTYTSSSIVMLDTDKEQVVDLQSVVTGLSGDTATLNTEVEVLRSRILIGQVVDALNLTENPEFNTLLRPLSIKQRISRKLRQFLGRADTGTGVQMNEAERDQWIRDSTISRVLQAISIRNLPSSYVFRITVETTDRRLSGSIADAIADRYIDNQLDAKFEATEQATSWLSTRVAELQGELETAEARVKEFSARTDLINQDALIAMERQLKDLRSRIDNGMDQLDQSRARLAALQQAQTREEKAAAAGDPQLVQLLNSGNTAGFDARFPQTLSRAQAEVNRQESQIAALEKSREELAASIEQQSNDLITLQQLTREAEANRLLYEYFLTRFKETSAQEGIQQADSQILSRSVLPIRPTAPRKSVILATSALLGLLLGAALVLLKELRKNNILTSRELEQLSGYTVMGQVPLLRSRGRKDVLTYLQTHPTSAAAEAIRNLRTSIMLSNVDHPPQVIMATSSVPAEGKTTSSLALAQNFVGLGQRVLLIEGDIRRRILKQYLVPENKAGMISVLTGEAALDDAIFHEPEIGIDILIGEQSSSNAADLFSSQAFAQLVQDAREHYDTIIIDTPPVLVVPDARIIAQYADIILFVVAWDKTAKNQVQESLHMFESLGRSNIGMVLNQINPRGMRRYGYGGNYGSYGAYSTYGQGYYTD